MASGINSTFRQVGIATGIALLGTLFSSQVKSDVLRQVASHQNLAHQGPKIATAVQSGGVSGLIAKLPPATRQTVADIPRTAFTTGLNRILLIAAIIALAAGVLSLLLIRGKDFAHS